jgi:hypothetical protein
MMAIVSLKLQRAYIYRNGMLIGVSTVSTGVKGRETPTGVFTILQKEVDHKSNLYDDAPMPFMQRLTWDGIAMHAGRLPGYPASHGCVRLPLAFAKLLYAVTGRGMTVVITDSAAVPRVAPTPDLLQAQSAAFYYDSTEVRWDAQLSPAGPVSIVISTTDKRIVVLRNGQQIGSGPVAFAHKPLARTVAYVLRPIDDEGPHWLRLTLPGDTLDGSVEATPEERQNLRLPERLRDGLAAVVGPGTTVVQTPDTLRSGSTGQPLTILSDDR